MRSLSPDEAALWARVTESIRPLSRATPAEALRPSKPAEPLRPSVIGSKPKVTQPRKAPSPAPAPRIGLTLDGSWDRSIRSGNIQPDRTLDLHGMNLDRAWTAIDQALEQAVGGGERVLLLITGHARTSDPPIKRGLIRAAVHDWLAASRHASRIAAVRGAHRRHGGGGSLYIILRRG